MRLVSTTPPSPKFLGVTNSDLAFTGKYVDPGQLQRLPDLRHLEPGQADAGADVCLPGVAERRVGLQEPAVRVGRRSDRAASTAASRACPSRSARIACAASASSTSPTSTNPKYVTNVQTCRGSHTHTVVTDPQRQGERLHLCVGLGRRALGGRTAGLHGRRRSTIRTRARFRLEVIKVPLAAPEKAAIVSSPRIFHGLAPPPRRVEPGRGGAAAAVPAAAPARRRAGAAAARRCRRGAPARPRRRGRGGGGGGGPRRAAPGRISATTSPSIRTSASPAAPAAATGCCSTSATWRNPMRIDAGGRHQHVVLALGDVQQRRHQGAVHRRVGRRRRSRAAATPTSRSGAPTRSSPSRTARWSSRATTRCPAPQTSLENCVAHNGSLIPIPGPRGDGAGLVSGRHLGVRLDRRRRSRRRSPSSIAARSTRTRLVSGGSWSVYWYNGLIVSSEIARGLDIFELLPSGLISQNELDAAKTVRVRLPERAGAAQVRVAGELRQGARVSRSARARQRPRRGAASPRCARSWPAPRSCPAAPRQRR